MSNDLIKAQIEAALFLTEKPMRAQAVARLVNAEVNLVRQMIIELIHDYESRNGGLEVADDDGYIIQVKDEYTHFVDEFVPIDMPTALIRTLSAIAIKQPVLQSEIIKIRGAGAYDHIKELIIRELINKREEGRSPILTTTKKFQEYFRLSKDGKHFRQQIGGHAEAGATTPGEEFMPEDLFDASPDPDAPPIGVPGAEEGIGRGASATALPEELHFTFESEDSLVSKDENVVASEITVTDSSIDKFSDPDQSTIDGAIRVDTDLSETATN